MSEFFTAHASRHYEPDSLLEEAYEDRTSQQPFIGGPYPDEQDRDECEDDGYREI